MSSMVRNSLLPAIALSLAAGAAGPAVPAAAQNASDWDNARANLVAQAPGRMAGEIRRWEQLTGSANFTFSDYATFLLTNPGFPLEDRLRDYAERRLRTEFVPQERLLAYFAAHEPISNFARAHLAIAQMGGQPQAAQANALAAWRGGEMSETAEAMLAASYGHLFTQADHDARMDALLWQREAGPAARQLARVSPEKLPVFAVRLSTLQGGSGATDHPSAMTDPGYLYNRSRELRTGGRQSQAVSLLANRPLLASLPLDQTAWVTELLAVARTASARQAQQISAKIDDAFEPGTNISAMSFKLRDDYTSLMWLGGTKALWDLGDGSAAAPLFYRYGAAARTPQTRSKGFFWAGHAASRAGDAVGAASYYEMAAIYPDRFYGQLALIRLGRPLPDFAMAPSGTPTAEERAAFRTSPLAAAVSEVARDAPWSVGIRFYREIADQADTVGQHILVADMARDIGRRDLAVILAEAAMAHGHGGFTRVGFPKLEVPAGTNWTMVHAIARQESQFAQNAISHAGARGLMQLMPGTAQEEAQRAGISYMSASLINDASYNIRLGSNHIERLLVRYNGSYPLAFAAYNAGPGNVNRWLRDNGDPRTGAISWIDWIEKITFPETRGYVLRVIENAVVYEALYPELATQRRARSIEEFLR